MTDAVEILNNMMEWFESNERDDRADQCGTVLDYVYLLERENAELHRANAELEVNLHRLTMMDRAARTGLTSAMLETIH